MRTFVTNSQGSWENQNIAEKLSMSPRLRRQFRVYSAFKNWIFEMNGMLQWVHADTVSSLARFEPCSLLLSSLVPPLFSLSTKSPKIKYLSSRRLCKLKAKISEHAVNTAHPSTSISHLLCSLKIVFFPVHCNPSPAGRRATYPRKSVQSLLLADHFLYNQ